MKKTLIATISALAAATMAANAATTVSYDSLLQDWMPEEAPTYSAFETASGKTPAQLSNGLFGSAYQYSTASSVTFTVSLNTMYQQEGSGEFKLTSFSILQRYNTPENIGEMTAKLTVGGVTYTSSSFTSGYQAGVYGSSVFTFTDGPILQGTESATVVLSAPTGQQVSMGIFQPAVAVDLNGTTLVASAWSPVVRVSGESTAATPEPATASLSLLGLAALMMRRRRA